MGADPMRSGDFGLAGVPVQVGQGDGTYVEGAGDPLLGFLGGEIDDPGFTLASMMGGGPIATLDQFSDIAELLPMLSMMPPNQGPMYPDPYMANPGIVGQPAQRMPQIPPPPVPQGPMPMGMPPGMPPMMGPPMGPPPGMMPPPPFGMG